MSCREGRFSEDLSQSAIYKQVSQLNNIYIRETFCYVSQNHRFLIHISCLSVALCIGLYMRYSLIELYQKRPVFWYSSH
jgi:hypothetical protein